MKAFWNQQVKPILKHIRSATIGEDWRDQVKPISWYNFSSWLWETIVEDFQFYQSTPRPLTLPRIMALLSPNLSMPIFIVGAPRSGTTFLGDCLGVMPEISYHFEPVITKAATRYVYLSLWSQKFSQRFYRSIYSWLMRLHLDADLIFAEKTPQVSLIIPFLITTFPDAKFIHIIRDGRDSAISLSKKPWYRSDMNGSGAKEPDGYPFGSKARFWVEPKRAEEYETTNDLHRCIWLWRRYLETIMAAAPQLSSDQYYELRYEDLVTQPADEAEKLLDFISIRDLKSRTQFKDTVVAQAKPTSVGRWQTELSAEQCIELWQEAGVCLRQLGYLYE
jgi:hypothetical protein